jgi:hypothetical protein
MVVLKLHNKNCAIRFNDEWFKKHYLWLELYLKSQVRPSFRIPAILVKLHNALVVLNESKQHMGFCLYDR